MSALMITFIRYKPWPQGRGETGELVEITIEAEAVEFSVSEDEPGIIINQGIISTAKEQYLNTIDPENGLSFAPLKKDAEGYGYAINGHLYELSIEARAATDLHPTL